MANGPRISVSADLSSFDAEIQKLKTSITQLGDSLKTETGKADLDFNGPKKQLDILIAQADKLTAALGKTDKTSASYAKNVKAAAVAMADAAKLASRIESQGGSNNRNTSNYFSGYSAELRQDASDTTSENAAQRERDRTRDRLESERQANTNRWASRAARLAGFGAGTMIGGGGGYAAMGAGVGSLLPGWLGTIGGGVGGAIGGLADRTIGSNKDEALRYSEIRRGMGGLSVDFESLRESVRSTVIGFGVTNVEAANLAKSFVKTAALSDDVGDDIARSVGSGAALAQGYGIDASQTVGFAANMRLNGVGKNESDQKRFALQIGESVARVGMASQFGPVLDSISGFVSKSTAQTLTAPNYGEFTSLLSSMIGSNYSGLHGNVANASNLIGAADQGVRAGGSFGEASGNQWLIARTSAIPDMSVLDNSSMQEMGALGDISAPFKAGSPLYDNATSTEKSRRDKVAKSIEESGYHNQLQIGMDWAKKISGGDYNTEIMNIKGLFGIGSDQQAAALKQFSANYQGQGDLEKNLGKPLKDIDASKIPAYAEVIQGGTEDRKKYYQNIKKNLSTADVAEGDKALAAGGDTLKNFLIKAIDQGISDPGLDAQKTSIELQNKMAKSLDGLVDIENIAKEALLGIWKALAPDSPALRRIVEGEAAANGKDRYGSNAFRSKDVMEAVGDINMTSSVVEKKKIAKRILDIYDQQQGTGFPSNTEELIENALYPPNDGNGSAVKPASGDDGPTIPASTPGSDDLVKRLMRDNKGMKKFHAAGIMGNLMHESGGLKSLREKGSGDGLGYAQWSGSRRKKFEAYAKLKGLAVDSQEANYGFLNEELHGSQSSALKKLLKTDNLEDATKSFQDNFERPKAGYEHFDRRLKYAQDAMDQLPESHKQEAKPSKGPRRDSKVSIAGEFILRDPRGNIIADPISTRIGAPIPAGYN